MLSTADMLYARRKACNAHSGHRISNMTEA
jgi:hypothetical protein